MVVVPPATAVTSPVAEIVATEEFEETQGLVVAGVPDPVNCKVAPPKVMF